LPSAGRIKALPLEDCIERSENNVAFNDFAAALKLGIRRQLSPVERQLLLLMDNQFMMFSFSFIVGARGFGT
jgi:hypothetical protein